MADINWHSKYEEMVSVLTSTDTQSGSKIFETNKDLIKFAAMVGYKYKKKDKPDSDGKAIPLRIFQSTSDEELIYLVALMAKRDANILRKDDYQDNENEVTKVFEEYANGGLAVIQDWLQEEPIPGNDAKVLLEKITGCFKDKVRVQDREIVF